MNLEVDEAYLGDSVSELSLLILRERIERGKIKQQTDFFIFPENPPNPLVKKLFRIIIKKLTKPESLVSDYFILIKEDRVPLRTHKMRGGF